MTRSAYDRDQSFARAQAAYDAQEAPWTEAEEGMCACGDLERDVEFHCDGCDLPMCDTCVRQSGTGLCFACGDESLSEWLREYHAKQVHKHAEAMANAIREIVREGYAPTQTETNRLRAAAVWWAHAVRDQAHCAKVGQWES